jgi:hypothetical protein
MTDEQKIIMDCDHFDCEEVGKAIICAPTNIICTVQAGGMACSHPEVEGFPIGVRVWCSETFNKSLEKFNDCGWGCCLHINSVESEEAAHYEDFRIKYAKAIEGFLSENLNERVSFGMIFEFDHERIEELMEGWWPVLVRFKNNEFHRKPEETFYPKKLTGYLYFGNCD